MKLKKLTNLKQKIICIPIIAIMLISFIMPNYVHADIGETLFEGITDILIKIPDGIIIVLEQFIIGRKDSAYEIIQTTTDTEQLRNDIYDMRNSYADAFEENPSISTAVDSVGSTIAGGAALVASYLPFVGNWVANEAGADGQTVSTITYTPKAIFSGQIKMFKTNFFSTAEKGKSIAINLRNVIATWYVALRNIALVAMLIMLVYTGIKIMISSAAGDKAKYKEWLINWIIGICLILFIHYFMVFMISLNDAIVKTLVTKGSDSVINIAREAIDDDSKDVTVRFGYALIYTVMVIYILMFTWQYLKRVVKLAFLILFAPIIAATYPIDKMTDGQSQGFNNWIKDFIFTLLIQPLHLMLYTVLIGSVATLANENMIYTLVALGSLIPVEGMLRNYLGFGRAKDGMRPPNPAGMLAAASLLGGVGKRLLPSNIGGNKGGNGRDGSDGNNQRPIDTSRGNNAYDLLLGGNNSDNQQNNNEDNQGNNTRPLFENPYSSGELDDINDSYSNQYEQNANNLEGETQDNTQMLNNPYSPEELDDMNDYLDDQFESNTQESILPPSNENGETQNLDTNINTRPNRLASGLRRIKTARGFAAASAVGRRLTRPLTNGNTGIRAVATVAGKAARIGAGITLGAGAATAGLAMGIASGDVSKAAQLGIGGAVGGYAAGSRLTGAALSSGGGFISDTVNEARRAYNPERYQQQQDYKQIVNNKEVMRKFLKDNPNRSEKDIRSSIEAYTKQGITDTKKIQKGLELEEKAGVDRNTALGTLKLADKFDSNMLMDDKKEEKVRSLIEQNLSGRGYTGNAKQKSEESVELLKMANGLTPMRRI